MSKIKELLRSNDNILVFDVDGVLAILEWDEYNHFTLIDEDFAKACINGSVSYNEEKVSKKMQTYLKDKDMSKVYVITKIGSELEGDMKREFVNKFYNIPKENYYCVRNNNDKLDKLRRIKEKYPDLENHKLVMIEDTVSILTDIMRKTGFSTVHISSFLDI